VGSLVDLLVKTITITYCELRALYLAAIRSYHELEFVHVLTGMCLQTYKYVYLESNLRPRHSAAHHEQ
jgi:hypothetical protein